MVFERGRVVQGGADVPFRARRFFFRVVSSGAAALLLLQQFGVYGEWTPVTILMHGQGMRIPWLMRAWPTMAVGIGSMVVADLAWSLVWIGCSCDDVSFEKCLYTLKGDHNQEAKNAVGIGTILERPRARSSPPFRIHDGCEKLHAERSANHGYG